MEISAAIAAEVGAQIAAKGWSLEQAREAFGWAKPTFDRYLGDESGIAVRSMGWEEYCQLATALGYTPSQLVHLVEYRAVGLNA